VLVVLGWLYEELECCGKGVVVREEEGRRCNVLCVDVVKRRC